MLHVAGSFGRIAMKRPGALHKPSQRGSRRNPMRSHSAVLPQRTHAGIDVGYYHAGHKAFSSLTDPQAGDMWIDPCP